MLFNPGMARISDRSVGYVSLPNLLGESAWRTEWLTDWALWTFPRLFFHRAGLSRVSEDVRVSVRN